MEGVQDNYPGYNVWAVGVTEVEVDKWTSEEIKHNPTTGELLTMNTWEYKPPAAKDIPQHFRVTLLRGARNPMGVMSSKDIKLNVFFPAIQH